MKNKRSFNALILSLILVTVQAQAYPTWTSILQNYFNKPTQAAFAITTAVAGVSMLTTLACVWKLWKKNTTDTVIQKSQNSNSGQSVFISRKRKRCIPAFIASKEHSKTQTRKIVRLTALLINVSSCLQAAMIRNNHLECRERVSQELMRNTIGLAQGPDSLLDGIQLSSTGCDLRPPPLRTGDEVL